MLPWQCLVAQTSGKLRDDVVVDAGSGLSVTNNSFTDVWQPSPAVHFNVRLPFYRGQIELGARYIQFDGMPVHSDFHSIFIHGGYSFPIRIASFYQLAPTIRFGNNFMLFDQPEVYTKGSFRYSTDPSESEFAYELALRNQFKFSRHWSVNITASYNRTLTHFPLSLGLISGGISYSFSEPQWLKDILQ